VVGLTSSALEEITFERLLYLTRFYWGIENNFTIAGSNPARRSDLKYQVEGDKSFSE
jgi:hypothetical protein